MIAVLVAAALQVLPGPPTGAPVGTHQGDGARRARADELWDAGRRIEALDLMQAVLDSAPGDGELRLRLAERQLQVHRNEACLVTIEALGPAAAPLRGRALYLLGRLDEAAAWLAPIEEGADEVTLLMLIDTLEATGRVEEALAVAARAAHRLGPDHPALLGFRGRRAALDGRHEEAVTLFRGALERDPLHLEALYGLGQALVRCGDVDEGRAVLQRHRELVPRKDRYEFALRSIDLDPTRAGHHAQLGDALRDLGRIDEARAAYARAAGLATPEELAPVALRRARALLEDDGDLAAAVQVLDQAAALVEDARLWVRAGDLLLDAGRTDEARARYQRAADLRPDDPAVRARLLRAGGTSP